MEKVSILAGQRWVSVAAPPAVPVKGNLGAWRLFAERFAARRSRNPSAGRAWGSHPAFAPQGLP